MNELEWLEERNRALTRLDERSRVLSPLAKDLIRRRIRAGASGPGPQWERQFEALREEREVIDAERRKWNGTPPDDQPGGGVRGPRTPLPGSPTMSTQAERDY